MKTSQNHHYLSQCYLRGFTNKDNKKSRITVFDLKRKKIFETNTRNVGGMRDFNRIDINGFEPDAVEKTLSTFESKVASALRHINETFAFDGENKNNVLAFIALLSVRSPYMRRHWEKLVSDEWDIIEGIMLQSKKRWNSIAAQMKEDGYPDEISYEEMIEMREMQKSGKIAFTLSTEFHLYREFISINIIYPLLLKRQWLLIHAAGKTGPFITTDKAVLLTWKEPEKIPPFYRDSPGFGMSDTQVIFPLSQRLLLIGELGGKEGIISGNTELIARLNSIVAISAFEKIYSPHEHFYFMVKENEIREGTQILSYLYRR